MYIYVLTCEKNNVMYLGVDITLPHSHPTSWAEEGTGVLRLKEAPE